MGVHSSNTTGRGERKTCLQNGEKSYASKFFATLSRLEELAWTGFFGFACAVGGLAFPVGLPAVVLLRVEEHSFDSDRLR